MASRVREDGSSLKVDVTSAFSSCFYPAELNTMGQMLLKYDESEEESSSRESVFLQSQVPITTASISFGDPLLDSEFPSYPHTPQNNDESEESSSRESVFL